MAARLSMLGFPFWESMRCRLFAGLAVSRARPSNPNVALTRSRSRSLAVCASPFRNSVAASSSNALANSGSRCTRSMTVRLESRVIAITSSLPWVRHERLARPVFLEQPLRPTDVGTLPLLCAAPEQNDQSVPFEREIDPIAWPPIDAILCNGPNALYIRRIAKLQQRTRSRHLRRRLRVQAVEPAPVRARIV